MCCLLACLVVCVLVCCFVCFCVCLIVCFCCLCLLYAAVIAGVIGCVSCSHVLWQVLVEDSQLVLLCVCERGLNWCKSGSCVLRFVVSQLSCLFLLIACLLACLLACCDLTDLIVCLIVFSLFALHVCLIARLFVCLLDC